MSVLLSGTAWACPADRLLNVVVPYAAGGSVDVTTRIVARTVSQELGRMVNVSNVPGASGLLAVRKVLGAERDGCTLLAGSSNTVVLVPLLNPHADFTSADLRPVGRIGSTEMVLVAGAGTGLRNLQAVKQAATAGPAPLRAGHPGQESMQTIALHQLQRQWQARLIEVPYSGAAQLVNDLVAGHIDIAVLAKPAALPLVQRGALNLVATLGPREGLGISTWSGWFAARGVPGAATEAVERALEAASGDAAMRQALAELGLRVDEKSRLADFTKEVALTVARLREDLPAGSGDAPSGRR